MLLNIFTAAAALMFWSLPASNSLIFLVGLAHSKGKNKNFGKFNDLNFKTLNNLLSSMQRVKKIPDKIIFISSISVYGEKLNKKNYTEEIETVPISPYAKTKLKSENYLLKNFEKKTWILRLAPVYSQHFLLNLEKRSKVKNYLYKVGDGSNMLSLCNIENINIVTKSILEDKVPFGIYNIADSINYTYNDILSTYENMLVVNIPKYLVKFFYIIGYILRNNFLIENSIKLISDNLFPSSKICKYITLPYNLNEIKK